MCVAVTHLPGVCVHWAEVSRAQALDEPAAVKTTAFLAATRHTRTRKVCYTVCCKLRTAARLQVAGSGSGSSGPADSIAKLHAVQALCREMGVVVTPMRFGRLWIVPLLAWHHQVRAAGTGHVMPWGPSLEGVDGRLSARTPAGKLRMRTQSAHDQPPRPRPPQTRILPQACLGGSVWCRGRDEWVMHDCAPLHSDLPACMHSYVNVLWLLGRRTGTSSRISRGCRAPAP